MEQPDPPRVLPFAAPPEAVVVQAVPGVLSQLARAAWPRGRAQGRLSQEAGARLGPIAVEQRGRRMDPQRIARFRAVCGYAEGSGVPPVFLETLFHGLLVELLLSPAFPLRAMGLVHLRQRLLAHRPIAPDASLDLRCHLAEVRATARGLELDCAMEAREGDDLSWEGLATLFSRDPEAQRGGGRPPAAPPGPQEESWSEPLLAAVPADTGRRYAAASGDYNPFHLHALLARPFGFPRAIAHGMWTLGWALAQVEGALSPALQVEATFRKPLFLPGRVALRRREVASGLDLEVRHPEQDLLYLAAEVRW
ncbi:MAG: MaoC/PaaZ C-terminal domain-containing protein [Pseudomonadota bacterium]